MMKKILSFFFVMMTLISFDIGAYAQTRTVRGKVTDQNGEPLPGVGVIVKGTMSGTSTDGAGAYSITVSSKTAVLQFSSLGMKTVEEAVQDRSTIDVVLAEDSNFLEETVVIGYGVQKKVHMTGSVVAVSSSEIAKMTTSNVSQALVGKLPGLITQQGSGGPGGDGVSILVRGYSSYTGGGAPLVLVDGVERDMNLVNPADIESVSVLKDAAASAVYGMKAANGVILVTTKRGSNEKTNISYNGRLTLSTPTALPQMMNGTQYMKYYNLGTILDQQMAGVENPVPFFTDEEIAATCNGDPTDGFENTDWTSPMRKTTPMHQHNISVSGGSQKVKYFTSGGFMDQRGYLDGNYNKRINVRSNIDMQPTKNLKISLNLGGFVNNYKQQGAYNFQNGVGGGSSPFIMLYSLPFVPKEMDGMPTSAMRTRDAYVANAEYGAQNSGFSNTKRVKIESSASAEYSFPFLKGLKAGMFYSWDWTDSEGQAFSYAYNVMAYQFSDRTYAVRQSSGLDPNGNLFQSDSKYIQQILRPSLSFNREFGKHNVSALLLYEQTQYDSKVMTASRKDFKLLDIADLSFGNSEMASNSGSSGKSAYAGFVGRLNYAYNDKYLLEGSFRYDGSYKFAKGHRWGFFPSLSAGWVLSKEDFFKDALPGIQHFKLRASAGEVGSDNVSAFLYRKKYSFSQASVAFGQVAQSSIYNTVAYPNYDLTWERTRTVDGGFELNAWNGKLGVEFDYFYKYTYDILNSVSAAFPPSLGGNVPTSKNDGEFDNRGFELSLSHENRLGDFYYKVTGNLTYAHNRILKKTESSNVLPWQSVIGTSIGDIWGLEADGLYQTQEELDNAPAPIGTTPKLGDIKFKDYNGDGKIDINDYVRIARSTRPEMMFAMQFDAAWKGFDLTVQFQGAALADKMLIYQWANGVCDATPLTKPWYAGYDNTALYLVEGAWRPDNTDAEYPRLSVNGSSSGNNYRMTDFWKRNGTYLRLKNVTLGYSIPSKVLRKVNCAGLRVFASGVNLLTLTEFKYLDPESPNSVTGYYPQQRTVTFGIDLSF